MRAAVVGIQKEDRFLYVESVKNGFVPTTRRLVQDSVERLHIRECPFDNWPEKKARFAMDREKMRKVRWVKPKIRCEVAFNEWTENGHICGMRDLFVCERNGTPAPASNETNDHNAGIANLFITPFSSAPLAHCLASCRQ